jgi:hypothetical protein
MSKILWTHTASIILSIGLKKAHEIQYKYNTAVSHSAITQYIYVWYLVSLGNTLQENI